MSTSTTAPLVIARRLAIQLLHEAQIAAPLAIHGFVGAVEGSPCSFAAEAGELARRGEAQWAEVFSNPLAPAIPDAAQLRDGALTLMISLTTKGVLQMRAWSLQGGQSVEFGLQIQD